MTIKGSNGILSLPKVLESLCLYYNKQPMLVENLTKTSIPSIQFDKNIPPIQGIRNILSYLVNYEKAEKCAVDGWAEFCITKLLSYRGDIDKVLEEMNNLVSTRVYLVGYQLSAADVLVYFFLYDLMITMSSYDKVKFIHLCRWFDNVQRQPNLRAHRRLIPFSRTKFFCT